VVLVGTLWPDKLRAASVPDDDTLSELDL